MRLTALQKSILQNRLMDKYGQTAGKIAAYNEYLDGVIIDLDLFPDYSSAFEYLTNNYGRLEII